jgi:hypothetical protein
VPIGRYKAEALYKPAGQEPVPMLIRARNAGSDYAASAIFDFESLTELIYRIELEVKLP